MDRISLLLSQTTYVSWNPTGSTLKGIPVTLAHPILARITAIAPNLVSLLPPSTSHSSTQQLRQSCSAGRCHFLFRWLPGLHTVKPKPWHGHQRPSPGVSLAFFCWPPLSAPHVCTPGRPRGWLAPAEPSSLLAFAHARTLLPETSASPLLHFSQVFAQTSPPTTLFNLQTTQPISSPQYLSPHNIPYNLLVTRILYSPFPLNTATK